MEWFGHRGKTHVTGWEPDYRVELEGGRRGRIVDAHSKSRYSKLGWGGWGVWRQSYKRCSKKILGSDSYKS